MANNGGSPESLYLVVVKNLEGTDDKYHRGSSTETNHKNWSEVKSFTHNIIRPHFPDFKVNKYYDHMSPSLFEHSVSGEHVDLVALRIHGEVGTYSYMDATNNTVIKRDFCTIVLHNVVIGKYDLDCGSYVYGTKDTTTGRENLYAKYMTESVTFNYEKIEYHYQDADVGFVGRGWDVTAHDVIATEDLSTQLSLGDPDISIPDVTPPSSSSP